MHEIDVVVVVNVAVVVVVTIDGLVCRRFTKSAKVELGVRAATTGVCMLVHEDCRRSSNEGDEIFAQALREMGEAA